MDVLMLAVFLLLLWIGFRWKSWSVAQFIDKLPGPKCLPILGNVLQVPDDDSTFLQRVHNKWPRQFGGIYRLWIGHRPVVVLSSAEFMEPILTNSRLLTKAFEYSFLSPWLGNCTFLATGPEWKSRRRLLMPSFHFRILNNFVDSFNAQSRVLVEDFHQAIGSESSNEIDVMPYICRAAINIICETSMGIQLRDRSEAAEYQHAVHRIMQIVLQRGKKPWFHPDWIFNHSRLGRETHQCVKVLHEFTYKVIKERREALRTNPKPVVHLDENDNIKRPMKSFLDMLIENESQLSDEYIREEVDLILFAGHDTTYSAMIWFLYCIAGNQTAQDKLYEEVNGVFGDSDRDCTTQDIKEMKYLECCIKECLRIYPSAPAVMRCLTEDVQVGDYWLPAGVSVALSFYGAHHDPTVFEDPEEFKPERFLSGNCQHNPFSYLPFSAGVRNCIGQKYGMLEVKVLLSTLIRHFRFSVTEESKRIVIPCNEIVLKPKTTMPLVITRRNPL